MTRSTLRADVGVGAIAISPSSRDAVLAGRSGLYVADLYDPFALPRWSPLRNAWEVASVQWCPDPSRSSWVVSSNNQETFVWNLELPSDQAVEHVLQGHRRAVTDISFSQFRQDQLATSSIDTTVCLWDSRKPRYATMRFVDFSAGAVQVKMSPIDENQLASAHNNRVVLWDRRWANKPAANWVAHIGECNGIEFMANGKSLTCSTDRTIKLWDLSSDNFNTISYQKKDNEDDKYSAEQRCSAPPDSAPESTINATYPIWRALPTPYELGATIVPLRGGDNTLRIINLARQTGVHSIDKITLPGGTFKHPASVKSAVYMRTDYSGSHYDIVTWSRDAHLREWKGEALLNLPHASSASGCKDDEPIPIPQNARTYNTDMYDAILKNDNGHDHQHRMFDLPVLNHRKDIHHRIAHLDWISGIKIDHNDSMYDENEEHDGLRTESGNKSVKSTWPSHVHSKLTRRHSTVASEELSQEIVMLSMRMPKVTFEDINIWAGTCDIRSMGPWGVNGEIVHIHANVKVPREYPYEPMHFRVLDDPLGSSFLSSQKGADDGQSTSQETTDIPQIGEKALNKGICEYSKITEINQFLYDSCSELSRHGIRASEFCVRYLVGDPVSIEDAMASENALPDSEFGELEPFRKDGYDEENTSTATDSSTDEELDIDFNEFEKLGMNENPAKEFETDELENHEHRSDREENGTPPITGSRVQTQDVIDSTPVPKSCGAVWSNTGKLVCFFNQKATTKGKGPLPLDKIFADDSQSTSSDAPFVSDSDDFEHDIPEYVIKSANWSLGGPQMLSDTHIKALGSSGDGRTARVFSNGKSVTNFTTPLDYYSTHVSGTNRFGNSRTLTSHNSDDVWSLQRRKSFSRGLNNTDYDGQVSQHKVIIKDFVHLWPSRPDLASEYNMNVNGMPLEMAQHNAGVAHKYELNDDEHIWRLLINYIKNEEAQYADPYASMLVDQSKFDWTGHRIGFSGMLPKIAEELERRGNVQLLVGISTILSALRLRRKFLSAEAASKRPSELELTILEPNVEALFELNRDGTVSFLGRRHTGSTSPGHSLHEQNSEVLESWGNVNTSQGISPGTITNDVMTDDKSHRLTHIQQQVILPGPSFRPPVGPVMGVEILDNELFDYHPQSSSVYSRCVSVASQTFEKWTRRLVTHRLAYAKLLHIWGLDIERAEVLKFNLSDPLINQFRNQIEHLIGGLDSMYADVEIQERHCSLCDTLIVKTFEFCSVCTHAMHSACAQQWWQAESDCPTACGCSCKDHARCEAIVSR